MSANVEMLKCHASFIMGWELGRDLPSCNSDENEYVSIERKQLRHIYIIILSSVVLKLGE